MKFCKLNDKAKTPQRAFDTDCGMDVYFCPQDDEPVEIWPGESFVLGTGISVIVPDGYALRVDNKSGIASRGIIVGACIIDPQYRGEVKINLINVNQSDGFHIIFPGDKIAQLVLYKISLDNMEEISKEEYFTNKSERGAGGFGSTGIK